MWELLIEMDWHEYELLKLKESRTAFYSITLSLVIVGSIFLDWWAVYSTYIFIDMMQWHQYPERMLVLIGIYIGSAIIINSLTVLLYFSIRKEKNGNY